MTRLAAILAALALPLLAVACGGGDDKSATPETVVGSVPAETSGDTTGGGGEGDAAAGEAVFKDNCATCHTLSAAGASGTVGPNLDDVKPDAESSRSSSRTLAA